MTTLTLEPETTVRTPQPNAEQQLRTWRPIFEMAKRGRSFTGTRKQETPPLVMPDDVPEAAKRDRPDSMIIVGSGQDLVDNINSWSTSSLLDGLYKAIIEGLFLGRRRFSPGYIFAAASIQTIQANASTKGGNLEVVESHLSTAEDQKKTKPGQTKLIANASPGLVQNVPITFSDTDRFTLNIPIDLFASPGKHAQIGLQEVIKTGNDPTSHRRVDIYQQSVGMTGSEAESRIVGDGGYWPTAHRNLVVDDHGMPVVIFHSMLGFSRVLWHPQKGLLTRTVYLAINPNNNGEQFDYISFGERSGSYSGLERPGLIDVFTEWANDNKKISVFMKSVESTTGRLTPTEVWTTPDGSVIESGVIVESRTETLGFSQGVTHGYSESIGQSISRTVGHSRSTPRTTSKSTQESLSHGWSTGISRGRSINRSVAGQQTNISQSIGGVGDNEPMSDRPGVSQADIGIEYEFDNAVFRSKAAARIAKYAKNKAGKNRQDDLWFVAGLVRGLQRNPPESTEERKEIVKTINSKLLMKHKIRIQNNGISGTLRVVTGGHFALNAIDPETGKSITMGFANAELQIVPWLGKYPTAETLSLEPAPA